MTLSDGEAGFPLFLPLPFKVISDWNTYDASVHDGNKEDERLPECSGNGKLEVKGNVGTDALLTAGEITQELGVTLGGVRVDLLRVAGIRVAGVRVLVSWVVEVRIVEARVSLVRLLGVRLEGVKILSAMELGVCLPTVGVCMPTVGVCMTTVGVCMPTVKVEAQLIGGWVIGKFWAIPENE